MNLREDSTSLAMLADIEIRELGRQIRRAWPIANDLGLPLAKLQMEQAMLEAELRMMEEVSHET